MEEQLFLYPNSPEIIQVDENNHIIPGEKFALYKAKAEAQLDSFLLNYKLALLEHAEKNPETYLEKWKPKPVVQQNFLANVSIHPLPSSAPQASLTLPTSMPFFPHLSHHFKHL